MRPSARSLEVTWFSCAALFILDDDEMIVAEGGMPDLQIPFVVLGQSDGQLLLSACQLLAERLSAPDIRVDTWQVCARMLTYA